MKTLWWLLMRKNIDNWKKALEWWIVREMMLKKLTLLKKAKKINLIEVIKHHEVINNSLKP